MRVYLLRPSRDRHKQRASRHNTTTKLDFPLLECQPDFFLVHRSGRKEHLCLGQNTERLPHQGWGYREGDRSRERGSTLLAPRRIRNKDGRSKPRRKPVAQHTLILASDTSEGWRRRVSARAIEGGLRKERRSLPVRSR